MKFFKSILFAVLLVIIFFCTSIDSQVLAKPLSDISAMPVDTSSSSSLATEAQNDNGFSDFIQDQSIDATQSLVDYGNWCGQNNTSTPNTRAIDGVDEVCKAHDLCIGNNDHKCGCDARFLRNMPLASASSEAGEAYKIASIPVISAKPCYCSARLPNYPCCNWRGCKICQGGEIRWPGVGGQCGPRP